MVPGSVICEDTVSKQGGETLTLRLKGLISDAIVDAPRIVLVHHGL